MKIRRLLIVFLAISLAAFLLGCGKSAMPLDYQLRDEIAKAAKGYKIEQSVSITGIDAKKCTVTIKADVNKWEFGEILHNVTPVVRNFLGKNRIELQWLWYDSEDGLCWHSFDGKEGTFEDKNTGLFQRMELSDAIDYCGYVS